MPKPLTCLRLTTALILIVSMNERVHADPAPFYVKQVTYSGSNVSVRCEADLTANVDSILTLSVPNANDQSKRVLESIHTSLPARIGTSLAGEKTTITVKISSPTAKKAGVTYLNEIVANTPVFNVKYGIEQSCNELDGYVQVFDQTGSTADWKDAKLVITRPSADDLCFPISMGAGESIKMPLESLQDYPIKLDDQVQYARSKDDVAYCVVKLTNPGKETLLKGSLRVMQKGVFQYATELRANLPGTSDEKPDPKSADLLVTPVSASKVSIQNSKDDSRWHETVSIIDGILTYKPWPISTKTIENKTDDCIVIYLDNSSVPINVAAKQQFERTKENSPAGDSVTTDLFELSETALAEQTRNLGNFGRFSLTAPAATISSVLEQLKIISKSKKDQSALNLRLNAVKEKIAALSKAGADERTLRPLLALLTRISSEIEVAKSNETNATTALIPLLFPQPVS